MKQMLGKPYNNCSDHLDRQGGQLYTLQWIRAIKQNPQTIVISSWNEFSDETAIESALAFSKKLPALD